MRNSRVSCEYLRSLSVRQVWAESRCRCGPSPGADVGRVPMQMWAESRCRCGPGPSADVGQVLRRCGPGPSADVGRVPVQMWAESRCRCGPGPSANVGQALRRCGPSPGADVARSRGHTAWSRTCALLRGRTPDSPRAEHRMQFRRRPAAKRTERHGHRAPYCVVDGATWCNMVQHGATWCATSEWHWPTCGRGEATPGEH